MERQLAVAFLLTGGLSLIFDFGVIVAVVAQAGWIALEAVKYQDGVDFSEMQGAVINLLLLVVLLKECCGKSCGKQAKQEAPSKPPVEAENEALKKIDEAPKPAPRQVTKTAQKTGSK
jgi:hypothetical protein